MVGRVLVTGSDGYIGTVLCSKLESEYDVVGCDTGFFRHSYLYGPPWNLPKTLTVDVRDISLDDLAGFDAVVCLSDLNDPVSQAFPDAAEAINFAGNARLASLCRAAGVSRMIYSSSATVYGSAPPSLLTEASGLTPLTAYARCKARLETHLLSLCDESFGVACLRNGTVYGLSPRMRLDLVANNLCATAASADIIRLSSDGSAWRPLVHIEDVCEAFCLVLRLPSAEFSGLVVNVGDGLRGNLRIMDLAKAIQEVTGSQIVSDDSVTDERTYRMDTGKLNALGLSFERDLVTELDRMVQFFKALGLKSHAVSDRSFVRLEQIRYLLGTGQIDDAFFWRR